MNLTIAVLSKFLKKSDTFIKNGIDPPIIKDSLATKHDIKDPEND